MENNIGGVLLNGASINIPELGDQLNATVRDNDLSGNTSSAQAFGLRVFILRRDHRGTWGLAIERQCQGSGAGQPTPRKPNRPLVDAGFPYRRVGSVCDSRVYSGTVDLTLAGNTLAGSTQTPALVTFTRSSLGAEPFVVAAVAVPTRCDIRDFGRRWDVGGRLDRSPSDRSVSWPVSWGCDERALGNVFVYNGVVLPNGRNLADSRFILGRPAPRRASPFGLLRSL